MPAATPIPMNRPVDNANVFPPMHRNAQVVYRRNACQVAPTLTVGAPCPKRRLPNQSRARPGPRCFRLLTPV